MPEIKYYVTDDQYDPWNGEEADSLEDAKDRARSEARDNEDVTYYVVTVKVTPLYSVIMEMTEEDLDDDND